MDAHVLLYTRIVGFLQSVDGRGESEKPAMNNFKSYG